MALWSMLLGIVAESEKRFAAYTAHYDLTPPQFFVLKTLMEHNGKCPIGQIAREHHLTNATLTGLVKRLEAMNPPLVKREQSTRDKRSVTVFLTPEGSERFTSMQHVLLDQMREILGLISPEERRDLMDKITRYVFLVMEHFPVDSPTNT